MTVTLTPFGGVGEIGGNAFLLEAPGFRAMLDVGKRFGAATTMEESQNGRAFDAKAFDRRPGFGDYFDTFQGVRAPNAVGDLGSLDLIPWKGNLPSLYRADIGGSGGPAPVDLILLSHAHLDHCGLLGLIRPDIPVATSAESVATLASIETTGIPGWATDYTDVQVRGGLEAKPGGGYGRLAYKDGEKGVPRRFVTDGKIPEHQRWKVEFFPVDHSIQGAAAFILTDGDTKIVYTGDFRQHGWKPEKTRAFLKAAVEPDVLLIEGTRVGNEGPQAGTDKEADVEAQVRGLIERHEAMGGAPFVGIGYPPRDLDRFRSLHKAAAAVGRRLLINTKQAHLLNSLRASGVDDLPDWRTDPNVGVFVGSSKVLRKVDHVPIVQKDRLALDYVKVGAAEWRDAATRELTSWEFQMLGGKDEKVGNKRVITTPVRFGDPHIVATNQVAAEPGDYLFSLNLANMADLFDIFPDRSRAGGLYIHSQTQPHNDDMEMDQFRLRRWLRAFNLNAPDHEPRRTHVSGHVSASDLDQILDDLKPKLLVPIHSERPDLSSERYRQRTGRKAILPRWGHPEVIG